MGRRARTQLVDDEVVVELASHRSRKRQRGVGRSAAKPPKQSHRQRAADGREQQEYTASLGRLRHTEPRSAAQGDHLGALQTHRLVMATGPAGTGKTYCPVAHGMDLLAEGQVERLVFLRPTVEAGGSLGFLPGKLEDKIDPFFAPIRLNIAEKMGSAAAADRWITAARAAGQLVFLSIQHLRGYTLKNCFTHLDEAQNCTYSELKLVVTRMGEGSWFSLCGDADQTDIGEEQSGWREIVARLAPLDDWVSVVRYQDADVVRDPLLRRILPHL